MHKYWKICKLTFLQYLYNYVVNLEQTRVATSTMNIVGVHAMADDGAVGISVLLPTWLLQLFPSQMRH